MLRERARWTERKREREKEAAPERAGQGEAKTVILPG